MPVDVRSEKLTKLVDENVEVERLGTGFTFTEGPIWHPRGEYLLFSDMPADIRRKWTPDGTVVEVMNPSNKCNGMTYDADLNLLVCEHSTSSARPRTARTARVRRSPTHYQGKELNSPNDIVVHSSGAIYFTDPTYGRWPGFGVEREQDLDFQGVYRLAPGGGDPELLVDDIRRAERALLLARRVAALHQRHAERADPRLRRAGPTGRSRTGGCSRGHRRRATSRRAGSSTG